MHAQSTAGGYQEEIQRKSEAEPTMSVGPQRLNTERKKNRPEKRHGSWREVGCGERTFVAGQSELERAAQGLFNVWDA